MQLRHKSCFAVENNNVASIAWPCHNEAHFWLCPNWQIRQRDERERMRERAECLLRGKSIFHSCFSHVAIKLTRSNMSVVSFVGKYVCVCVFVCVCICCIHCANFSNLNRQFQSIATAYRFRHEFYFLLPSIAAFQQSRAGKTLQTEQWRIEHRVKIYIWDISNTFKVVWIHLPESITTHTLRQTDIEESQAINLINTCISHPLCLQCLFPVPLCLCVCVQ